MSTPRQLAIAHLGSMCLCGSTRKLEFHHTLGNGDKHRAEYTPAQILQQIITDHPLAAGIILLCHKCHLAAERDRQLLKPKRQIKPDKGKATE